MSPAARLVTTALALRAEGLPVALAWQRATDSHPCAPASRRLALATFTAAVRRTQEQAR